MQSQHRTSSFSPEVQDRNPTDREVQDCTHDAESESGSDDDCSDQSDQPPPDTTPPDTTPPDPLEIEILAHNDVANVEVDDLEWLYDKVVQVTRDLDITDGCIEILVTGDEGMTQQHHYFLGIAETTDVLTFHMSSYDYDVHIIVCYDVAVRHVVEHGGGSSVDLSEKVRGELLLYIVHGLLHTLGYDDQDESDYQVMHQREDEILEALGVGRLFEEGCEESSEGNGNVSGG